MEHNYTTGDKIRMKTKQETRKTRNKARLHKFQQMQQCKTNAMTCNDNCQQENKMSVHRTEIYTDYIKTKFTQIGQKTWTQINVAKFQTKPDDKIWKCTLE